jgi:DNA-binding response OmpR family regulator
MENVKVLVVEDESSIRKFININLERSGFEVIEAESGEEGLKKLIEYSPEVIVLDIMLPGIDGFEVCRTIREKKSDAVVIMLTAKGQDMDKIVGLELGADDYMVKPFNPLELVARIRANLRRINKPAEDDKNIIATGKIKLDITAQKFYKDGVDIELTPREFAIVKVFMENQGKALSRDELLNHIWGRNYFGDIKTVDVHIRRLREKIEDDPSEPKLIETVWGFGYRWRKAE